MDFQRLSWLSTRFSACFWVTCPSRKGRDVAFLGSEAAAVQQVVQEGRHGVMTSKTEPKEGQNLRKGLKTFEKLMKTHEKTGKTYETHLKPLKVTRNRGRRRAAQHGALVAAAAERRRQRLHVAQQHQLLPQGPERVHGAQLGHGTAGERAQVLISMPFCP